MSLALFPPEIIRYIFDQIEYEADRQSLRNTCRGFKQLLPPPLLYLALCQTIEFDVQAPRGINGQISEKAWLCQWEQHEFLMRLIGDMPDAETHERRVCLMCCSVVDESHKV